MRFDSREAFGAALEQRGRIVGGVTAEATDHPWTISIRKLRYYFYAKATAFPSKRLNQWSGYFTESFYV